MAPHWLNLGTFLSEAARILIVCASIPTLSKTRLNRPPVRLAFLRLELQSSR